MQLFFGRISDRCTTVKVTNLQICNLNLQICPPVGDCSVFCPYCSAQPPFSLNRVNFDHKIMEIGFICCHLVEKKLPLQQYWAETWTVPWPLHSTLIGPDLQQILDT
jgi:hypothetical protein